MKKLGVFLMMFSLVTMLTGAGCGSTNSQVSDSTHIIKEAPRVASLADFYKNYKDHEIAEDEFTKRGFLAEVFKINTGRTDKPDYYEFVLTSFYSDKDWNDGKDHEIYMEMSDDREGLYYYGPFMGNMKKLIEEGKSLSEDAIFTEK
jgi:hypothetical protein